MTDTMGVLVRHKQFNPACPRQQQRRTVMQPGTQPPSLPGVDTAKLIDSTLCRLH